MYISQNTNHLNNNCFVFATTLNLQRILPPPRQAFTIYNQPTNPYEALNNSNTNNNDSWMNKQIVLKKIPPYGEREGYVPRDPEDFGDGGSFPEIHIKQYPLDMGRKDKKKSTSGTVALRVDSDGRVRYDAILRQGMRKEQIMHSRLEDMTEKEVDEDSLMKPTEEETSKETQETRLALEKLLSGRITSSKPRSGINIQTMNDRKPTYIRYTPGQQGSGHNSGASTRMIKLYSMPIDPLEPPKYRHKKLPQRPPSPPVPIMHSPPPKITIEDQKNWKIPPCVSNWKNPRGYTMALHQRLAADGRNLQNHTINDKFAKLAESLLTAERQARKGVEHRANLRQKIYEKEKKLEEEALQKMAKAAKQGLQNEFNNNKYDNDRDIVDPTKDDSSLSDDDSVSVSDSDSDSNSDSDNSNYRKRHKKRKKGLSSKEIEAREERDRIRKERERIRNRDYRLEQRKGKLRGSDSRTTKQRERDITEKIALGEFSHNNKNNSSLYDSRLFDKSSGLNSGFGGDDEYNLYTKPLFNNKSHKLYRPKNLDLDMISDANGTLKSDILNDRKKIKKPHVGFEDVENDNNKKYRRAKGAPVQFEKESSSSSSENDDTDSDSDSDKDDNNNNSNNNNNEIEMFGLSKHLKTHNRKNLDNIVGKSSYMHVSSGGGGLRIDNIKEYNKNSKRSNVNFIQSDSKHDDVNYNNYKYKIGLNNRNRSRSRSRSRSRDRHRDRHRTNRNTRYDRDYRDERHRDRSRDRDRDRDRDSDRYRSRRSESDRYDRHSRRDRYSDRDRDRNRGDRDRGRDRHRYSRRRSRSRSSSKSRSR